MKNQLKSVNAYADKAYILNEVLAGTVPIADCQFHSVSSRKQLHNAIIYMILGVVRGLKIHMADNETRIP